MPVAAWMMGGAAQIGYRARVALHIGLGPAAPEATPAGPGPRLLTLLVRRAQGNTVTLACHRGDPGSGGKQAREPGVPCLAPLDASSTCGPLRSWLLWSDRSRVAALRGDLRHPCRPWPGKRRDVPWLASMMDSHEVAPGITIGPSAWLGRLWPLVGIPSPLRGVARALRLGRARP